MRFMLMVRATPMSESGQLPDESLMAEMAEFHEQLARAGVLLEGNGLQPSSRGWRVRYEADGARSVVDGPFAETKELIAGYTMIQVRTREEALEWSRRFPTPFPGLRCEVEVRQVYELEDFAPNAAVDRFRELDAASR